MKNSLEFLSVGGGLESQKNLTVFDLESLSASQFYTGDLPSMSAAGAFIKGGNKEIDWSIPSGYEFKSAPYVDKTPIKALNLSALKTVEKFDILDKPDYNKIGTFSEFSLAKNKGLNGGGLTTEINGWIERYREPEWDKKNENHLNLLNYGPKKTKEFLNTHLDLNFDFE